jgi:hypothetical protein
MSVNTRSGRIHSQLHGVEEILAKKLARLVEARTAVNPKVFSLIAVGIARKMKLCAESWKAGSRRVRGFLARTPASPSTNAARLPGPDPSYFSIRIHAKWCKTIKPLGKLYAPKEVFNIGDSGLEIEVKRH